MNNKLSIVEVFAIVLGAIIGWGSFMLPGTKFLYHAGVINTALGLLMGVICIAIIERSYHVMMEAHCEEGGEFSYVYKYFGRHHGFIVGWFLALAYLTMIPLNATAFPLVINKLFEGALEFGYLYTVAGDPLYVGEVLTSFLVILFFMLLNLKGLKETGRTQVVIVLTLISCSLIVFIGMFLKTDHQIFMSNYLERYQFSLREVLKVFAITPFLYVGFDAIPQLSKNLQFNTKKASLLAVVSLSVGMLVYDLLNITTAMAYSPSQAINMEWALGSAVMTYIGKGGFFVLVLALGAAVSSGINGFMICSTKLLGAMGRQGVLHKYFGEISSKGVLKNAIVFVSGMSLVASWFGREVIIWIVDMSSLGAAIAYFYVCLVTARREKKPRIKKIAWLGVGVSILFILLLTMPFSPAQLGEESFIALFIWCILGFSFWLRLNKNLKLKNERYKTD